MRWKDFSLAWKSTSALKDRTALSFDGQVSRPWGSFMASLTVQSERTFAPQKNTTSNCAGLWLLMVANQPWQQKLGQFHLIPSVMAGSAAKIARRTASIVGFSGCVILATCAVTPGQSSCSRQDDAVRFALA